MSKVTFENSDGTKKIVMAFREEGEDIKVDCTFDPQVGEHDKGEFYYVCFNHIASMLSKEATDIKVE